MRTPVPMTKEATADKAIISTAFVKEPKKCKKNNLMVYMLYDTMKEKSNLNQIIILL